MKIIYNIHRVSSQPSEMSVTLGNGQTVPATVKGLEVELVPQEASHGTTKLWFLGDEDASLFVEGGVVQGDFTVVTADPVEEDNQEATQTDVIEGTK